MDSVRQEHLAPRLRELDADLETIELALRAGIVAGLESDVTRLPSHLRQKIDERLQAAAKRTPALDRERLATLAGMLEYADLRELQDVLTNKALWPAFQPRFGSKELLLQRFSQTADLRNSIRHSRQVDEITRKEGEAAILWFRRVLDV